MCADYNHVRSWSVTRFRGMINTQPGSVALASFKLITFEDSDPPPHYYPGNNFGTLPLHPFYLTSGHVCLFDAILGPFGERDDTQVFVQKLVPNTDQLIVRLASDGKRLHYPPFL